MKNLAAWILVLVVLAAGGTLLLQRDLRARALAEVSGARVKDLPAEGEQGKPDPETESADRGERPTSAGKKPDAEEKEKEGGEAPARVSRSAGGTMGVSCDAATQGRLGIHVEAVASVAYQPEVVAYGSLVEDPAESFTLRAPAAGILRSWEGREWPNLGETLNDNATVAALEPRLSPAEQLDLASRLASARADMSSAAAALEAGRASYASKKELHDRDKACSARMVEEAEAQVKTEEARLRAATETVQLFEASLETHTGARASRPLTLPRSGEVVEVLVQPGETVESGQALLRVARFDRLLARVEIPAGDHIDRLPTSARVAVIGQEDGVLAGERIGWAPLVNGKTQGQTYLFRVAVNDLPVRPGAAVTAYLGLPGEPVTGVLIPRSAIVRYGGQTWVYVQTEEDRFERRAVVLHSPTEAGWFATSGVSAGDRIVVTGAQMLLSEELKAQIEQEEAAEE